MMFSESRERSVLKVYLFPAKAAYAHIVHQKCQRFTAPLGPVPRLLGQGDSWTFAPGKEEGRKGEKGREKGLKTKQQQRSEEES